MKNLETDYRIFVNLVDNYIIKLLKLMISLFFIKSMSIFETDSS